MNGFVFRPKQSLGQNFLVDENIARKITDVIDPRPEETIVEIGPGFGALTKYLLGKAGRLVAVEIDRYLCGELRRSFGGDGHFELIEDDFLLVNLRHLAAHDGPLKIAGNIPYQITSPVLFKLFEAREHLSQAIFMIQKEVAERIVARPRTKAYGILSVFSQFYSIPESVFNVSGNVFRPRPNVASTLVRWRFVDKKNHDVGDPKLFTAIVRNTFNQRRKMLRNSLQRVPEACDRLHRLDFDLRQRPEELSVADFVQLTNLIIAKM